MVNSGDDHTGREKVRVTKKGGGRDRWPEEKAPWRVARPVLKPSHPIETTTRPDGDLRA